VNSGDCVNDDFNEEVAKQRYCLSSDWRRSLLCADLVESFITEYSKAAAQTAAFLLFVISYESRAIGMNL